MTQDEVCENAGNVVGIQKALTLFPYVCIFVEASLCWRVNGDDDDDDDEFL